VARTSLYEHSIVGEGLDHCYDCRAEIEILGEYINLFVELDEDETTESR